MTESFANRLQQHLEDTSANCPFEIASALVSGSTGLMTQVGTQNLDHIINAAKIAWDKYFVPLDLPGIPNLVEPMVERFLWNAVEAAIRAAAARLAE